LAQVFVALRLRPHAVAEPHSSMSAHARPSGLVKPLRHAHVYEPAVLVQVEFAPHGVPAVHSLMSEQVTPVPE
jgi:hypothetical protein